MEGVRMRRFDLGMSLNYCPTWGVVESVREFFQNGIDAQKEDSAHELYWNYDEENMELIVGNKNCRLDTKSLLLGASSKIGKDEMIGQHGEGYKVATVVLLRLGKSVTVYNRKANEQWVARVIKSRRYGADVVVFDISKLDWLNRLPDCDLVFRIAGITSEEYSEIVKSNLLLQAIPDNAVIHTQYGDILLGEEHSGRMYAGGLLVTRSKYAKYGYNFNPSLVKLDRDRTFMDSIDTQFLCSKLITATGDPTLIYNARDTWDGKYIRIYVPSNMKDGIKAAFDKTYHDFRKRYGEDAIPVTDQDEFNRLVRNGYKAIMVSENVRHYVVNSSYYDVDSEPQIEDDGEEIASKLEEWFQKYVQEGTEGYDLGKAIVESACNYIRGN